MNKIPINIDQFTKHLTVVRGKKFVGDLNLKIPISDKEG